MISLVRAALLAATLIACWHVDSTFAADIAAGKALAEKE